MNYDGSLCMLYSYLRSYIYYFPQVCSTKATPYFLCIMYAIPFIDSEAHRTLRQFSTKDGHCKLVREATVNLPQKEVEESTLSGIFE